MGKYKVVTDAGTFIVTTDDGASESPGVPNPLQASPSHYLAPALQPDHPPGFLANLAHSLINFSGGSALSEPDLSGEMAANPGVNPLNPIHALKSTIGSIGHTFLHPIDAFSQDPIATANTLGAPVQFLTHPLTRGIGSRFVPQAIRDIPGTVSEHLNPPPDIPGLMDEPFKPNPAVRRKMGGTRGSEVPEIGVGGRNPTRRIQPLEPPNPVDIKSGEELTPVKTKAKPTPSPIEPVQPGGSPVPANAASFRHPADYTDLIRQFHATHPRGTSLRDLSAKVFGTPAGTMPTYDQALALHEWMLRNPGKTPGPGLK